MAKRSISLEKAARLWSDKRREQEKLSGPASAKQKIVNSRSDDYFNELIFGDAAAATNKKQRVALVIDDADAVLPGEDRQRIARMEKQLVQLRDELAAVKAAVLAKEAEREGDRLRGAASVELLAPPMALPALPNAGSQLLEGVRAAASVLGPLADDVASSTARLAQMHNEGVLRKQTDKAARLAAAL